MAPISLQTAFTSLQNLLKDISDVPQSTFVQWCEFIQEFTYRYLTGVDPERFIKEIAFPITAGVQIYPIQSDFRDMQTWNTGFYMTDDQGVNTGIRLPLTTPGSGGSSNGGLGLWWGGAFAGYYLNGSNYVFTPNPTKNLILIQRYTPVVTPLVSINQYFTTDGTITGFPVIPGEYIQYLVKALAVQYMVWDEEVGAESYSDARFTRTLDELCENIRRQPQAMPMLDFSGIY